MVSGFLYHSFHIAAAHEFGDHVGLLCLLTQVEHGNDVWVGRLGSHGLSLTRNTGAGDFVQALGLDQGEGHLPVQQRVLGQVYLLFAAVTQEALDLVAVVGERGALLHNSSGNKWCWLRSWCGYFPSTTTTT